MFFVFGPNGQQVRGASPLPTQISAIRRVQRAQALRTRSADVQAAPPRDTSAAQAAPPPALHEALGAVSAYLATEKGPQPAREPLRLVSDVMSHRAMTVAPDTLVNDAWQQLAEHGVAQAPVINAMGKIVGLLLRADMAPLDLLPEPGAVADAIALARRPVREAMLSPVPTVSPDTELRRVAAALLDCGLPGLPVTDETGALAGFISRTDILKAVAADPPLDLWS